MIISIVYSVIVLILFFVFYIVIKSIILGAEPKKKKY